MPDQRVRDLPVDCQSAGGNERREVDGVHLSWSTWRTIRTAFSDLAQCDRSAGGLLRRANSIVSLQLSLDLVVHTGFTVLIMLSAPNECSEQGGTSWSRLPVPFSRRIVQVLWYDGRYMFEIAYKLSLAVKRPKDLYRITVGSASSSFEQAEAAIEHNFGKIDGTIPIGPVGPPVDWAAMKAKMPRIIEDISFHTTIVALGRRIRITVTVDREGSCKAGLRRAASIMGRLDDYVTRAKAYAASEFLELKNNNWLAANQKPISNAEFQAEMRLFCLCSKFERLLFRNSVADIA
jgi:hypothetical protein